MKDAAILYFFPGSGVGIGLGDAWMRDIPEDRKARFRQAQHRERVAGPDGRGVLMSWQSKALIDYDPKTQTWRQIGPKMWVGVRNDYSPVEFARPLDPRRPVTAYPVLMGDGKEWLIPVALADAPNFSMPWREARGPEGDIIREVPPPYKKVCDMADQLWRHTSGELEFEMEEDALREALATALAVHYEVDLEDCLALGLLTNESYQGIVAAILDYPSIAEIVEGKASGPPATVSGDPESSDGTNPPSQI